MVLDLMRSETPRDDQRIPSEVRRTVRDCLVATPTLDEHSSLEQARDLALYTRSSAIPVVDHDGRVSGLLLARDIFGALGSERAARPWSVAQAARRCGVVVGQDWPLDEIALHLELEDLPAVAVVDIDGRPIGICERSDAIGMVRSVLRQPLKQLVG